MPLSSVPAGTPSIPSGATKVSLKAMDPATSSTKKVDVTTLGDSQRVYASPPLKDANSEGTITATCTASGYLSGGLPSVDAPEPNVTPSGWLTDEAEVTYSVGEYAQWSVTMNYYEPPAEV